MVRQATTTTTKTSTNMRTINSATPMDQPPAIRSWPLRRTRLRQPSSDSANLMTLWWNAGERKENKGRRQQGGGRRSSRELEQFPDRGPVPHGDGYGQL